MVQVKVKRRGDDQKFLAEVLAIGTECDIALLTVRDDAFWQGVVPLQLGPLPRLQVERPLLVLRPSSWDPCHAWFRCVLHILGMLHDAPGTLSMVDSNADALRHCSAVQGTQRVTHQPALLKNIVRKQLAWRVLTWAAGLR